MAWLLSWQWPDMSEETAALVWVRMSYAWSILVTGMDLDWPVPRTEAQRRGVLRRILFDEWTAHGREWVTRFSQTVKTDRAGNPLN